MKDQIVIACDPNQLPEVRDFVGSHLSNQQMDGVEVHKIVLAVDEICANLIIHGNASDASKQLQVTMELLEQNHMLIFTIEDQGVGFDFSKYDEPDLKSIIKQKRRGGLGLMLVRRIMDQIEFSTEKNCNICRMVKKIQ